MTFLKKIGLARPPFNGHTPGGVYRLNALVIFSIAQQQLAGPNRKNTKTCITDKMFSLQL